MPVEVTIKYIFDYTEIKERCLQCLQLDVRAVEVRDQEAQEPETNRDHREDLKIAGEEVILVMA